MAAAAAASKAQGKYRPRRAFRREEAGIALVVALATLLSLFLSGAYYNHSYFETDTASYLFQARLFAQGRLSAEAPPDRGFSTSPQLNITNGKWYSKYPFGNATVLALGVLAGVPWLVAPLLTGGSIFLLYRILEEAYDARTALLGSAIAMVSPSTLVLGGVWWSEVTNRFFLGLFLLALFMIRKRPGRAWIALAGFALGYSFNTRPFTAVAFGAGAAAFIVAELWRTRQILRFAAAFLPPFALMLGLYAAWNWHLTGSPWQSTFNADQKFDSLGFGPHDNGFTFDPVPSYDYTLAQAAKKLIRSIPTISSHGFGWGAFDSKIDEKFGSLMAIGRLEAAIKALPLALPFVLMLLPLFHPSRNRSDALFFSLWALTVGLYCFYWWAIPGKTPIVARYYSECTMLGMAPLAARGMQVVYGRIRGAAGSRAPVIAGALLAPLLLNTAFTYSKYGADLRALGDPYRTVERLVKSRNVRHAVVFVQDQFQVPLGDYPFQALDKADIVYFKLGSSKVWELRHADWREAYDRWFRGRRAYLFRRGALQPVN